jgi:peroxiredoxin Q/BCP
MKRFMSALFCAGLVLAAAGELRSEETDMPELKKGDKAPDFELEGSDGKTYKLSDFKGKRAVVIAWFPKAFTGG